jgi:effector-binding domain-containing protein
MSSNKNIIASLLLLMAGIHSLLAFDEPKYRIIEEAEDIEVREYQSYLVAETIVEGSFEDAGSLGHRILASYISGDNTKQESIEMTTPVSQEAVEDNGEKIEMAVPVSQEEVANGVYRIAFVMPERFTLETLPAPQDERIELKEIPARKVVVIKYSGTWSSENYAEHEAQLQDFIRKNNYKIKGEPVWARYDPPWIPWFMRRNEIMIEVE